MNAPDKIPTGTEVLIVCPSHVADGRTGEVVGYSPKELVNPHYLVHTAGQTVAFLPHEIVRRDQVCPLKAAGKTRVKTAGGDFYDIFDPETDDAEMGRVRDVIVAASNTGHAALLALPLLENQTAALTKVLADCRWPSSAPGWTDVRDARNMLDGIVAALKEAAR